jgi:colanic acid biosynthesis glycosyl transferase WcaI
MPNAVHTAVSSSLGHMSAELGATLMRWAGTSVLLQDGVMDLGNVRYAVHGEQSSLNSLLPLLALAVIAGFFVRGRLWMRCLLVLSAVPISIIMNATHLTLTGVLVDHYGIDRTNGFLPMLDGWVIFMSCASLLLVEAWLLLRLSGESLRLLDTLDFSLVQLRPAPVAAGRVEPGSRGKLLLIASNFAPELTGIGKYLGEMAAWLAQAGFEIRVVTAPPYYPAWRVPPGYSSRQYMTQYLGAIRVYRCPLLVPRRPRGLTRLLHLLSFAVSTFPVVLWQAISWRPQLVFVVEPPLGCAPAALLGAKLCGGQAWLHVQDFEVDAAFQLGLLRGAAMLRFAAATERWLMRRFDGVSSISPRMLRKLLRKGVDRDRIRYFPNWVDTAAIRPTQRDNQLRRELGIAEDQRVLLYSGNMGEKQGLDLLVAVARKFSGQDAGVLFLLCGDGAAKKRTMEAAEGLPNIRFMPLQPLHRLNELLGLADIHLLPQRRDAEDLVMPSKLTAILASGRPVVASGRPGSDLGRAAAAGGIVVPPGDPDAFAAALCRLLSDAALRSTLSASGRRYAIAQWDRDVVLGNVALELDELLRGESVSVLRPAHVESHAESV